MLALFCGFFHCFRLFGGFFEANWFLTLGAIHSTKISGNFEPKLNGSVPSNRKSFEKTGPPFEVVLFSRSDRLEFWLNGSRPLIAFDKKDNAVPMQSGVRVFGRAKTNYIIAKYVYTRRFLRDRSFLGVFILDRAWPVWSGCEMTCFC